MLAGGDLLALSLAYAATLVLFVLANKLTTAASTIFLQDTAPIYILLLSPVLLNEPIRRRDLVFMLVIGIGMSQSGSRLGVYTNYIHMRAPIYDAFIIQVATPAIRDDLPAPLIKVLSETEASSGNLNADQPDTALRKTYWIAGSNHGDQTQRMGRNAVRIRDLGLQNTPNDSCGPGGSTPTRRCRREWSSRANPSAFPGWT